ncbi:MAG: GTP 3',8-cyclase MoaA [Candidatus Methanomethylicia archaeon]
MLIDRFGRPIKNLRISLTDRCNLKCIYCHREGEERRESYELAIEDIKLIAEASKHLEINRVKFTGGEPLLRRDIVEIVKIFSELRFEDISITTNGILIADKVLELKNAGLKRVNISLPSFRRDKYLKITGLDLFMNVMTGIREAINAKLHPVKINFVVLKNVNSDEINEAIEFANENEVILQLIELEPLGLAIDKYYKLYYPLNNIELELLKRARNIIVRKDMHARRQFIVNKAYIEIVKPMHNPEFCAHCTRIRVTYDGKIKPCLMRNNNLVDLSKALRAKSKNDVIKAFRKAAKLREPFFIGEGTCFISK